MRKVFKHSFETGQDTPYELPVPDGADIWGWGLRSDCKLVNCARCGKKIFYKDGFPSLEIFDLTNGDGNEKPYVVCEDCYGKEWEIYKNL